MLQEILIVNVVNIYCMMVIGCEHLLGWVEP